MKPQPKEPKAKAEHNASPTIKDMQGKMRLTFENKAHRDAIET